MPPRRERPPSLARAQRLAKLAERAFGDGWRGKLARGAKVNPSTVTRWLNATTPIPDIYLVWLEEKVAALKER